jgi:hypothetical protein
MPIASFNGPPEPCPELRPNRPDQNFALVPADGFSFYLAFRAMPLRTSLRARDAKRLAGSSPSAAVATPGNKT